ncbi:MAG TPA: dockerin type I domain-containing protein [Candidatus Saccharimonadales bacterium]|nr:dockerin type I domain-containing protein [Candidatus Saccharimonadales bacterium]
MNSNKKNSKKIAGFRAKSYLISKISATASVLVLISVVILFAAGGVITQRGSSAAGIDPTTWVPSTATGAWYMNRTNISGGTIADYQQRETQFGRKFDGHMFFMHNQVVAGDFDVPHWSLATDKVPFVMLSWGINPPSTVMADINAGKEDANIKFFADNVKSQLSPYGHVFIRPFYEFNIAGNPYNANNNPTVFINAWKHFVDIFRNDNVTNVKWVFDPNRVASSSTLNPVPFYPGASYVDWIAIDTYPKNQYLTPKQLVTTGDGSPGSDWYDTFKTYGKPLMVAEMAIQASDQYGAGTPTRTVWWNTLISDLKSLPQIRAFEYFDSNTNFNWMYDAPGTASGDSAAQALAGAKTAINNCYLNVLAASCNAKIQGDINNDGKVNISDLSMLLSDFGTANARSDLNNDGKVTINDLSILLTNWTG